MAARKETFNFVPMPSLPEAFEQAIRHELGEEFTDFEASLRTPAPVSIRLNPLKKTGIPTAGPVPWCTQGKYLAMRPGFTLDPLFHSGSYYVQEASSMFLEQALRQTTQLDKPLRVLDLCAAPGGKSTHLLSLISRDSLLVSNEAIRSRANILSENIQKWGYPNVIVSNDDPADFTRFTGYFDVIVVDAPCSGEGLFRKNPEAIREWSPDNVQRCAGRQRRIVSNVWPALRTGGLLLYSTCTYNPVENEENLKWLAENHAAEFLRLSTDPSWGIREVSHHPVIGYRFFPHRVRGEGFFLSAVRKTGATEPPRVSKPKKPISSPPGEVAQRLRQWLLYPEDSHFFQFNDLVFFIPSSLAIDFEWLLQSLKIVYAGTNMATVKHGKIVPEHAMALSVELDQTRVPKVELTEADVLHYLKKEPISPPDTPPGFALVTFQSQGAGWVNVLPNRVNNLYPSAWRIRHKD